MENPSIKSYVILVADGRIASDGDPRPIGVTRSCIF
jgi:hypothetical protein